MLRFTLTSTVVLCLVIATAARSGRGQCAPGGLNDGPLEADAGPIEFDVHFTNDSMLGCGAAGDFFSTAQAQNALDSLDDSYDLYDGFGFKDPYATPLPEFNIFVYDSGNIGVTEPACITLDAPQRRCSPEQRVRKTLHHEMFHAIQRRYMCAVNDCDNNYIGSTFGKWVAEGNARCLDDRLYADLDMATYATTFWEEVSTSTMPSPETSLVDLSYGACLFWSYCCEQMGTTSSEPQRGVDFLRRFWERIEANGTTDSMTALRQTITAAGGGSLDAIYHDYAICNYTREFDVSALPNNNRYLYLDEQPGNGGGPAYTNVTRWQSFNSFPQNGNGSINAYAARYLELTFAANECQGVGFLGSADEPIAWALVGVTSDNRATILSKGVGRDYGRTFVNSPTDPINRLCAIVIGLSEESDFDYTFDVGTLRLNIVRPKINQLAYAGPAAEPGRFLARVLVEGPNALKPPGVGQRSVKGLRREDFRVRIGMEDATVVTASYVGNEYWLVVQAPEQAVDGLYDLDISLCEGVGVGEVAKSAVLYGDIRINHAVVIDRSGSMSSPDDSPKLDAAKNAASLYVDSVLDTDRIAVIAFDGDETDCNDDAVVLEAMATATAAQRADAKSDIAGLSAGGWTSIGDGLWKAQDELDKFPTDVDLHAAVLLSDGEENEARWWNTPAACDTAASRILGTDTVVNTIAFGPDSNQTLMQSIAATTGGDYTYVDVTDSAALGSGVAAAIGTTSTTNQLADAYMRGLQRARSLERLFFESQRMEDGATGSFKIPVTEEGVEQGTLFVNWPIAAAASDVRLFDPNGNLIGAADATIYLTDTHKVYHLTDRLLPGVWTVEVDAAKSTEFIVGLLGRQRFGVQMSVQLQQINTGGRLKEPQFGRFEQGVPVTILAVLTDREGPVLGAKLDLTVIRPDGTPACGPLQLRDDGSQNDGEAGDGVYGAIFTDTIQAGQRRGVINDGKEPPRTPGRRGTYLVNIRASGRSALAKDGFAREADSAFQIFESFDRDEDGLPDTWEAFYFPDSQAGGPNDPKPDEDPDADGLTHLEEASHGTHPLDPDTDGGGESDGSEVKFGRCPLEASDDVLPCLTDVEVVTELGDEGPAMLRPGALLLRFPAHPAYARMRILRAEGPNPRLQDFRLIDEPELLELRGAPYFDEGLDDGVRYSYRFQAVGANGAETCLSRIVSAVAKRNNVPPKGWVVINNEATRTDRLDVVLTVDTTNGAIGFRRSNRPLTGQEPLERLIDARIPHTLDPRLAPGDLAFVYLQYTDAFDNESPIYRDTILFDPRGDFDRDGRPNALDPDDDNDGLDDEEEVIRFQTGAFDADSDDDGLRDREEIQLGTNPHNPDTDEDGLSDLDETLLRTDPHNPDTDRDGLLDGVDPRPRQPREPGDCDGDGDIDLADFVALAACFTGPVNDRLSPECVCADLDGDGDADLSDLVSFQAAFTGSQ